MAYLVKDDINHSKELQFKDLQIGDLFIRKEAPWAVYLVLNNSFCINAVALCGVACHIDSKEKVLKYTKRLEFNLSDFK